MPLRGVSASQGSTLSPGGQRGPEGAATTQHRATPCPIWTKKLVGYAAAGIPVYWILDLALRRLEVYRDPGPPGRAPGTGWAEEVIPEGGFVELVIDNRPFGRITVSELLPPAM